MFSLYSFGESLELMYGSLFFSFVYFASLVGGNLLSLLIHRKDSSYGAIGASGAVSGVIFASVVLFPEMEIQMFPIPIGIPSWAFAILYTLYSMYGMRAQNDNTGHDAHLGGAIIGMLVCICFHPAALMANLLLISSILISTCIFLFIVTQKPHLINGSPSIPKKPIINPDDHYNQIRAEKQKELDRILDKINKEGMESLNEYEKRFLNMNK
jgi:membrane associated rhomboid family serine protease